MNINYGGIDYQVEGHYEGMDSFVLTSIIMMNPFNCGMMGKNILEVIEQVGSIDEFARLALEQYDIEIDGLAQEREA